MFDYDTMRTSLGISLNSEMSLKICMYYLIHILPLLCLLETDATFTVVT